MWDPPWEERPRLCGASSPEGVGLPRPHGSAPSPGGPGSALFFLRGAGGLGRGVSLVPEGVQPRLFRDEALRTGAAAGVLGARRSSLLIAAAPAPGLTAPGMVWGGKATERKAQHSPPPAPHPSPPAQRRGANTATPLPGAGGSAEHQGRRRISLGCHRAGWKDRRVSCSQRMKVREERAREGLSGAVPLTGHLQDVTPSTPSACGQPRAQEKAPTKCDVRSTDLTSRFFDQFIGNSRNRLIPNHPEEQMVEEEESGPERPRPAGSTDHWPREGQAGRREGHHRVRSQSDLSQLQGPQGA